MLLSKSLFSAALPSACITARATSICVVCMYAVSRTTCSAMCTNVGKKNSNSEWKCVNWEKKEKIAPFASCTVQSRYTNQNGTRQTGRKWRCPIQWFWFGETQPLAKYSVIQPLTINSWAVGSCEIRTQKYRVNISKLLTGQIGPSYEEAPAKCWT